MTAPLCACGAVLPLGHPKSVLTCPGCGARSLPQEAAQENGEGAPLTVAAQRELLDAFAANVARHDERWFAGFMQWLREYGERAAEHAPMYLWPDPIAAAHAAGVAEERARILAILDANDEFDAYGIKASIRDAIEKGAVKG